MKTKIVNLRPIQDNKHLNTIKWMREIFKEKSPLTRTDEWTRVQIQYSHEQMWQFIQCYDLMDDFYEFVRDDEVDELSIHHQNHFKNKVREEYEYRGFEFNEEGKIKC